VLLSTDPGLAARRLLAGGLVGLPTETVYGLAADAESVSAVARVYAVKGRPADHPLIVHVADASALHPEAGWAVAVAGYARALAEALWPGPLTLVVPRGRRAGDHVTGGQSTVALRAPAHPMAQQVLAVAAAAHAGGVGLAAPSANRFGRVSPTTAAHVLAELGDLLDESRDAVLDGGPCQVGVESTIVDCTGPAPVILRPGDVGPGDLARHGGVPVVSHAAESGDVVRVRAPGTLASHYAPLAGVLVVEPGTSPSSVPEVAALLRRRDPVVGLLATADVATPRGMVRLAAPSGPAEYARSLYGALREADALQLTLVVAVPPLDPNHGTGLRDDGLGDGILEAVKDRLFRASHGGIGDDGTRSVVTT
jgi:L-threonylcarbamoyladenylate synthase